MYHTTAVMDSKKHLTLNFSKRLQAHQDYGVNSFTQKVSCSMYTLAIWQILKVTHFQRAKSLCYCITVCTKH